MKLGTILEHKVNATAKPVLSIGPDATIYEAIQQLCQHRIGALLVVDNDKRLIGILTERDVLMCCCAGGRTCREVKIDTVMTRDVIVASPDDSVENALQVMTGKRIRHLPVVAEGQIIGMVSIGDILRRLYRQDELKIRYLSDYIGGTYGLKVY